MSDADLEEIRRARLQQLREQGGGGGGGGEGGEQEDQRQRESDARLSILSQILSPEATDRLDRIRLVKASRALEVENRLIALARSGQLRQKITEEQLKEILGAVAEQQEQRKEIVVRRTSRWEEEDDDLLDL